MTHQDAGHYAAKHGPKATYQPEIAAAVRAAAQGRRLGCAAAHRIAATFAVAPAEVGKTMDMLECRLTKCQLGLFGYKPEKKVVKPAETVSPALEKIIRQSATGHKFSCAQCWQIADDNDLARMDVAAVCETLNIKISPCQLGAF